jgi:exonuclease V gamma subunit
MIEVSYSNQTSELVKDLANNLQGIGFYQQLIPIHIIVPNHNIEMWLKMEIASINGICSNIRFLTLESFWATLLPLKNNYQMLSRDKLQLIIIKLLLEIDSKPNSSNNPWSLVKNWLTPQKNNKSNNKLNNKRIFQLSGEIAALFWEYGLSRRSMVKTWESTESTVDHLTKLNFLWQKELWAEIFGEDGLLEQTKLDSGINWLLPGDLMDKTDLKELILPTDLHIFTLSSISSTFQNLFNHIADKTNLFFYNLNPSLEFWEDMDSRKRVVKKTTSLYENTKLEDSFENPFLSLWGKQGKETVKFLNILTNWDYKDLFLESVSPSSSLLQQIQKDILHRKVTHTSKPQFTSCNSIEIVGAPSMVRETEIIANKIITAMNSNHQLKFSDIAIIISDQENHDHYVAHLKAAFSHIGKIPATFIDRSNETTNRVIYALHLLFSLPEKYSPTALIELLNHPLFSLNHKIMNSDALNSILPYLPFDSPLWQNEDSNDNFHVDWETKIGNIALGLFSTGKPSNMESLITTHPNGNYAPLEVSNDNIDFYSNIIKTLRSIQNDFNYIIKSKLTIKEWSSLLTGFIESYINPKDKSDKTLIKKVMVYLKTLNNFDISSTVGENKFEYGIINGFIEKYLNSLKKGKGLYSKSGVTVSTLLPIRAIPFKYVYIMGLGEGRFPTRETPSIIDLRNIKRESGDLSNKERDNYLFLERLITTKNQIVLSYVSINNETGDILEPSSLINDFGENIMSFYLNREIKDGESSRDYLINGNLLHIEPTDRFDIRYFKNLLNNKDKQRFYFTNSFSLPTLKEAFSYYYPLDILDGDNDLKIRNILGITSSGILSKEKERKFSSLSNITHFLMNPLQGWAVEKLGNQEDIFEIDSSKTPLFNYFKTIRTMFLKEVFYDVLLNPHNISTLKDHITSLYLKRKKSLEIKGEFPSSPLGYSVEKKDLKLLNKLVKSYLSSWKKTGMTNSDETSCFHRYDVGHSNNSMPSKSIPHSYKLSQGEVFLSGVMEPFHFDNSTIVSVLGGGSIEKTILNCWIQSIILSSKGMGFKSQDFFVIIINDKTNKLFKFKTVNQFQAQNYLEKVLNYQFLQTHEYSLPLEKLIEVYNNNNNNKESELKSKIKEFMDSGKYLSREHKFPIEWSNQYPPPNNPLKLAVDFFQVSEEINFLQEISDQNKKKSKK